MINAGIGGKGAFFKYAFFAPIFSVIFAINSLWKSSPIYKITEEDGPLVLIFGMNLFLIPVFANLHEIQGIVIARSIWTVAWISSVFLALLSGYLFFRLQRRFDISFKISLITSFFGISVGGFAGAIFFKLISWFLLS